MTAALLRLRAFLATPLGQRIAGVLVGLLVILVVLLIARCSGAQHERKAEAAREAKVIARNTDATAKASDERAVDQAKTDTLQKDLANADAAQPDSRPSPARLAFNCERLRKQGSRLPAECRPGGGDQAAPRP